MANSSGLNERPSRTSLRGVATLYQGSIRCPLHEAASPAVAMWVVGYLLLSGGTRRPEPFDESSSTDCRLAPCRTTPSALAGQLSDGRLCRAPGAHRVPPWHPWVPPGPDAPPRRAGYLGC